MRFEWNNVFNVIVTSCLKHSEEFRNSEGSWFFLLFRPRKFPRKIVLSLLLFRSKFKFYFLYLIPQKQGKNTWTYYNNNSLPLLLLFPSLTQSTNNKQWTMNNEQWTINNHQRTMNNQQWTMMKEQWTMNNEQWSKNNEQWTMSNEQWIMNNEKWKMKKENRTMNNEQWTMKNE